MKDLDDNKIIQLFFNRSEQAIVETEKNIGMYYFPYPIAF